MSIKGFIKTGLSYFKYLFIAVWLVFSFLTFYFIVNSDISFNSPPNFIQEMVITCITISSIVIAAIIAYYAIITQKMEIVDIGRISMDVLFIPVLTVFFGLFSLYFSFFEEYFIWAKNLFALTMELTITNFLILYLITKSVK